METGPKVNVYFIGKNPLNEAMNPRFRRFFGIFLVFSALIAGVLYLVSGMLAHFAMTVPAATKPNFTPSMLNLPYETRHVETADHTHLAAWWIPSSGKGQPVVVIHGLGASKEFMTGFIVVAHETGHPVLAIDLRGHGESDPGPTTLGSKEPLDVAAWVGQLRAEGYPHPILWGISLGAVTALRSAAADPEIGGVIADAPFDTLAHTLAVHAKLYFNLPPFPLLYLTEWRMERQLHLAIAEVDSFRAARAVRCPLLIIAAGSDKRMSLSSVKAVYEAAHEPKRFYLSPGEDHETRRFGPEFRAATGDFLRFCDERISSSSRIAR
ncbi:MAG: alpha/beta fold hydrolase [Verrucomicrobium sp.]|nr:alpha/beta fold hydrolase [Verrucomicrobium sp.]